MMDSAQQNELSIVQSKFLRDEKVKSILLDSVILIGGERQNRILALVERETANALFVLISTQPCPTTFSDLSIERVVPIDNSFLCDIETESLIQTSLDIVLNISSQKTKFGAQVATTVEACKFVGDLQRVVEAVGKKGAQDFSWLQKYTGVRFVDTNSHQSDKMPNELDSPDIVIPRQKIAEGRENGPIRDSLLRFQMKSKENEYTHLQDIRVYIATWNVNGQTPGDISLKPWLSCDSQPPDIYAVGFQELDLSKEAFLFNDTPNEEKWRAAVVNGVHPGTQYRQVALVRLIGMLLIVLVKYELYSHVSNVAVDTVGTGIMGKMGNKGGVGVRFDLHNTSLCFVNSHLAAHTEEVERRNQDFHDICSRMNFVRPQPHGLKDHDQVYWLGDLNYRVTDLTASEVKERLNRGELNSILAVDQLSQQHLKKRVFAGFTEGPITFRPTYKYNPNSDVFDTSEKARAPAWCDRVLWKGQKIQQITYRSHPEMQLSDHKPVSSVFISQIRVVDAAKYRKIHEEVLKKMDKLENEFLPQVTVDRTEIHFGVVKFLEVHIQELIIANTGQVPVRFEFIKKLDDDNYCKDWLRITPYCGDIKPGEKCDVQLELQLKSITDRLYDILVLHLEGGKDVFITVSGNSKKSCFTTPMQALCRAPVPVSDLNAAQLLQMKNGPLLYSIPRELFLLIDYLYRHGMKQKNLFESRALHSELIAVRDWLDCDGPPPNSAFVVAESLLLLLLTTPEPVVPHRLHNQCIAASPNYAHCKQIIAQLPEIERNVFLYVCLFIQELLHHSNDNGYDSKTMATIFGDVLLPSTIQQSKPQASRSKAAFVHYFLINDNSDLIAMHR